MNRRWRDYVDGIDELSVYEDEELFVPFARKDGDVKRQKRPRALASTRDVVRRDRIDDETQRQRIARVKAWGVPY